MLLEHSFFYFNFSCRLIKCTNIHSTPTPTYHFDWQNNLKVEATASGFHSWFTSHGSLEPWAELSCLSHSQVCYLQIWKGSEHSSRLLVILYMVTVLSVRNPGIILSIINSVAHLIGLLKVAKESVHIVSFTIKKSHQMNCISSHCFYDACFHV